MRGNLMLKITAFFHGFIGVGAIAGGFAAIMNPNSPMGISVDMLKVSPFESFLIPGIILFGLIGLGNLGALLLFYKKPKGRGYGAGFMGGALICWIIVQCIMLQAVGFLHVLFFLFGVAQGIFAIFILYSKKQFPMPLILKIIGKLN